MEEAGRHQALIRVDPGLEQDKPEDHEHRGHPLSLSLESTEPREDAERAEARDGKEK
jgi:hypothetical protein